MSSPSRVRLYVAVSLDGFLADAEGGVGWLDEFTSPEGGDYGYAEFYASVGSLVMGRRTYEQVRGFGDWPYPGKPTRVFTRAGPLDDGVAELADAAPDGVKLVRSAPAAVVAELAAHGDVWLVGGAELFRSFREARLVDELYLTVLPVLLGEGLPLYVGAPPREPLELHSSAALPGGVVQLRYTLT